MRSFMTGSRAYGIPTEESDFDLVVLMDRDEAVALRAFSGEPLPQNASDYGEMKSLPIRFGKLNIIAVFTENDMTIWKTGTKLLKNEGPVTRDRAIEVFRNLRKQFG